MSTLKSELEVICYNYALTVLVDDINYHNQDMIGKF